MHSDAVFAGKEQRVSTLCNELGVKATLINSLTITSLGSRGLASPICCEGDDAGPIMRVLITRVELLEHFLANITRFQQ